MRILLTNDDGIRAEGIAAMHRALVDAHEVRVVAPETHQSAAGHGITLHTPLLTAEVKTNDLEGIAVDGRPADCTKLAVQHLAPGCELVVSGINHGANVGINVIYSGTVAAAIEGAFLGLPAIAVSLHLREDVETSFDWAATLAKRTIDELIAKDALIAGRVLNVNIPALAAGQEPQGVKIVRQCTKPWIDDYDHRRDPKGRSYFWNSSTFQLATDDPESDVAALRDKFITITPLMFDLTDHGRLEQLRK